MALLLVSRHFLDSKFISEVELPYLLQAQESRGLRLLWVMVSHCLYEETPLGPIQALLPTEAPLEAMGESDKNAALKRMCNAIKKALLDYERPTINPALNGLQVQRRMENLRVLASSARRRVEIFVRPDNSNDWYHQGPILAGRSNLTCHFGKERTKSGTEFHILAVTTEAAVTHQGRKPTNPIPKHRTKSEQARVLRA